MRIVFKLLRLFDFSYCIIVFIALEKFIQTSKIKGMYAWQRVRSFEMSRYPRVVICDWDRASTPIILGRRLNGFQGMSLNDMTME